VKRIVKLRRNNMTTKWNGTYLENRTENNTLQHPPDPTSIPAYNIIYGLGFGLICAVGTAGNIMVLLVIKRKQSMRSTTNFLLANLATADLLSLLAAIPFVSQMYFHHPRGELGHYLCVFLTAGNISIVSLITSVVTLSMLAFERYMALLKPMTGVRLNQDTVLYAVVLTWTIAISFATPYFVRTTDSAQHNQMACVQQWASPEEQYTFQSIFFIFLFIVPYLIITYCYGAIIKGIYFTHAICPMNVGTNEDDARSKRRIVEVLLIVTAMFTICVGSFGIVNALRETGLIQNENKLYHVTACLLYVNASMNPIVYAFRSSNYKRAFKEIFGFRPLSAETQT